MTRGSLDSFLTNAIHISSPPLYTLEVMLLVHGYGEEGKLLHAVVHVTSSKYLFGDLLVRLAMAHIPLMKA